MEWHHTTFGGNGFQTLYKSLV